MTSFLPTTEVNTKNKERQQTKYNFLPKKKRKKKERNIYHPLAENQAYEIKYKLRSKAKSTRRKDNQNDNNRIEHKDQNLNYAYIDIYK